MGRDALTSSRFSFAMMWCYVLAQGYMIPILPVGPSWAIWPRLADLASLGLILGSVLLGRGARLHPTQRSVLRLLIGAIVLGSFSLAVSIALGESRVGTFDGIYYVFRLFQFVAIFLAAVRVPLDSKRRDLLRFAASAALVLACSGIVATYFSIVPLGALTAHLPSSPSVSGPWSRYQRIAADVNEPASTSEDYLAPGMLDDDSGVGLGLGTIGYNHAYVSCQVLLLLAFRLHLQRPSLSLAVLYIGLGTLSVLLSESRAGLFVVLLFVVSQCIGRLRLVIPLMLLALGLIAASLVTQEREATANRVQSLLSPLSTDSLSGRPRIWRTHLGHLAEQPHTLLIGSGFGSARTVGKGSGAHMLPLQVLVELGAIGLLLGALLFATLLRALFPRSPPARPLFFATLALLLSCLSQETFYPVPAMGHFLGFYLLTSAIALSDPSGVAKR